MSAAVWVAAALVAAGCTAGAVVWMTHGVDDDRAVHVVAGGALLTVGLGVFMVAGYGALAAIFGFG